MTTNRTCFVAISMLLFAMPSSASELESIVKDCNGCHGDDGVSQWDDVPTIAGIDSFVHSEALYVYRDDARPCAESQYRLGDSGRAPTTMCRLAAALEDDQIEAIADYYSRLPFVPATQEFDAALATVGAGLHEKNCEICHSDGGSNPDDESSILAGQWMGYLGQSFAEYRSGERDQPPRMQQAMVSLSEADVQALLHYYASQQ